ncbi:MAG: nitronate monooxygenase [Solirubrobacterales bacterium]
MPVCELLGIETPIVQAGMSPGYTSPELVAAVSEAGGLGLLGALFRGAEDVRSEIIRTRELTSRPFGVNHVISQLDREAFEVTLEEEPAVLSLAWGDEPELIDLAVRLSIGAALLRDGESAHDVLRRADEVMYETKPAGASELVSSR